MVAAETVVAVSVAMVGTGWPKARRAPWAVRGREWLAGALVIWVLGWWVMAIGSGPSRQRIDLGLAGVLVAAVAVTVHLRPWLLLSWVPVAGVALMLRSLVPHGAPLGWPIGVIGPEGAVLGLLAGILVGDPVLAGAVAVGGGSLGALLQGPLGAAAWYLVSVAGSVALWVAALTGRSRDPGGSTAERLVQ